MLTEYERHIFTRECEQYAVATAGLNRRMQTWRDSPTMVCELTARQAAANLFATESAKNAREALYCRLRLLGYSIDAAIDAVYN